MRSAALYCLILSLTALPAANGQSLVGAPVDPNPKGIARPSDYELSCAPNNRYMVTMSVPGNLSMKRGCSLSFDFKSKTGEVERLELMRSSGNPTVDFDCICAVLGSVPFEPNRNGDHKNIQYTFGGRDLSAKSEGIRAINRSQRDNMKEKLSENGINSEDYFLCNVIPLSASFRYPGLFTDAELCDSKNLRFIPKTFFSDKNQPSFEMIVSNERFRAFFDKWSDFFSKNKKPTKEEIEKYRDGVDEEFSDMFSAPLTNSISKK